MVSSDNASLAAALAFIWAWAAFLRAGDCNRDRIKHQDPAQRKLRHCHWLSPTSGRMRSMAASATS